MYINYAALILLISCLTLTKLHHITLSAHRWCLKSLNALKILEKMQEKYQQQNISFMMNVETENIGSNLTYPRIDINCHGNSHGYENDLSFVELEYWIQIQCLRTIPKCSSWMKGKPLYYVPDTLSESSLLLDWVVENPAIKLCVDSSKHHNESITAEQHLQMFNSTLNNLPHFSQFNHNLRNYLIKSEKWAVLLVSDGKGDKRVSNDFADKISMLRKRDRKLGYHFDESAIGNVVFISDRMTNTVIRLLQFLDLADRADVSTPFILTFRFHDGKLMGYRHSSPIIDNKFIFWISELVASPRVAAVQHLRVCLAHQLIHYYQQNSLSSLHDNIRLKKELKKMKGEAESYESQLQEINVESIGVRWSDLPPFMLCIRDRQAIRLSEVQDVITRLHQHFSINDDL